jgi:hypothetical protein
MGGTGPSEFCYRSYEFNLLSAVRSRFVFLDITGCHITVNSACYSDLLQYCVLWPISTTRSERLESIAFTYTIWDWVLALVTVRLHRIQNSRPLDRFFTDMWGR